MNTQPTQVAQSGPGVDLDIMSKGLSVQMADPVEDFEYDRALLEAEIQGLRVTP